VRRKQRADHEILPTMTERRTRSGKVVGSYKPPLDDFTYWAENNWDDDEPGFIVVAPSGARLSWHRTEDEARMQVKRHQRDARALEA
jgi:hypothetical protein